MASAAAASATSVSQPPNVEIQEIQEQQQQTQSSGGSVKDRLSAYQNTQQLIKSSGKNHSRGSSSSLLKSVNNSSGSDIINTGSFDPRRKKPVPLPRSKLPSVTGSPGFAHHQFVQPARGHYPANGRFFGLGPRSKTDLTSGSLSSYKAAKSANKTASRYLSTQYPAAHPNHPVGAGLPQPFSRPVPVKRTPEVPSKKAASGTSGSKAKNRPEVKEKPTFSTFKSKVTRASSLSDLLNDNEPLPATSDKPKNVNKVLSANAVAKQARKNSSANSRNRNKNSRNNNNKVVEVETASVLSVNVNVPEPVLPPTKSITVQTEAVSLDFEDEIDANDKTGNASEPLEIITQPLNDNGSAKESKSLSTSFDSMDSMNNTAASKSTDVSMDEPPEPEVEAGVGDGGDPVGDREPAVDGGEDEEDLPTPPPTPPIEERLKSPVFSTTSRSPPSPTQTMTPKRKVIRLQCAI